ncbi:hypothetical protein ABZP07_002790 [Escherichia coli]
MKCKSVSKKSPRYMSAIIAKRYYSLTTHNLKTVMEQLAQGKRRCQQQFTSQEVQN